MWLLHERHSSRLQIKLSNTNFFVSKKLCFFPISEKAKILKLASVSVNFLLEKGSLGKLRVSWLASKLI